ncbi:hypothetical protein AVEN_229253-1 [Araneus ventricosus]|uniref:Uncharacterized protein n=1 Tax=Araneus ventricosus TaxID=182803 RepID=A0A4Y2SE28_ARAVE|nr:hypothetical protein AVEN_229253-1 [Araneus ventricosus]
MLSYKPVRRCSYYKATTDEHNLNNLRYAPFLKSSTKIKDDLSSFPPTSNRLLAMRFCIGTFNGTSTRGASLEEEELGLDQIREKHNEI